MSAAFNAKNFESLELQLLENIIRGTLLLETLEGKVGRLDHRLEQGQNIVSSRSVRNGLDRLVNCGKVVRGLEEVCVSTEQLLKHVLTLPPTDRAMFAEAILRSLDEEEQSDMDVPALLEQRYSELKSGQVKGRPADVVFQEAFEQFQ